MSRHLQLLLMAVMVCCLACSASSKEVIDPEEAKADPDFSIQGEYLGQYVDRDGQTQKVGCQVIARGNHEFELVALPGGLPGEGWQRGDKSHRAAGKLENGVITVSDDEGVTYRVQIGNGQMKVRDSEGRVDITLKRVDRKSPTLGAKPPAGAVVIFDGSNLDMFEGAAGHLTDDKLLLSGVTTKPLFGSYHLHLEFRLSWMPEARGQGRSNSGVYLHDCYECQVLDSFGLEGRHNECGGFYGQKAPDVNMCFPPMSWQTYDIDFTAPRFADGKMVSSARVTVRHNGVVIHDNIELPRATAGRKGEGPPPRGIHFQGHGNKVLYRNIWLTEKP